MDQGLMDQDPSLCKQKLATVLRDAREAAELSREDASSRAKMSLAQLTRIELASTTVRPLYLEKLLSVYGVDQDRWSELEELAEASRTKAAPPWWKRYEEVGAVSPEFGTLLKYESWATTILNFEPHLVPGLLQTPAYARAVAELLVEPQQVEHTVALRLQRQQLFHEREQLREEAAFILDENVLHRVVGGAEVMREQLRALRDALQRPGIRLDVMPFAYGLYPRFFESYVVFEAPSQITPLMLFLEAPHADHLYRQNVKGKTKEHRPEEHLADFRRLQQIATGYDPAAIIERAISEMAS
jgi:transcriptional regulator with XRE-family HTH domain